MGAEGFAIAGPYEHGDTPPAHLMGWAAEELGGMKAVEAEFEKLAANFSSFESVIGSAAPAPLKRKKVWEYGKLVNGGQHLPTGYQETGDCVSWGMRQAGQYRSAWEIAGNYEEEKFRYWFAPWIYGTSRVDIGGNRLRGAGSMGSWAAAAVLKYGILFDDDEGVPAYSGRIADSWGYGVPKQFYDVAHDNLVQSAVRLESVEQVRAALLSEEPCLVTIASNQGWAMQPVNYKGFHCFRASGWFGHQTCFLDWMDDPFPATYRQNSWGPNAHGTPLNGEPPGGAWWRAEDLEHEIRTNDVELYAISLFQGEKGPADNRIVR
jgi:hypothetical protein